VKQIKAIETIYNGYRFRSRLEARWAVFFDALGLEYEYEPEGFDLGDGLYYLPDFHLPDFFCGCPAWVEIKPDIPKPDSIEIKKIIRFQEQIVPDSMIVLAVGDPEESGSMFMRLNSVENGRVGYAGIRLV
jgi:hypothetical protein